MDEKHAELRDFVYFFIHNKYLTKEQMSRRDHLLTRDYESLKENVSIPIEENKKEKEGDVTKKTEKVLYISPSILHDLLFRFNQDKILKYTCHEIDTEDTIELINEECGVKSYSLRAHAALLSKKLQMLLDDFSRENIFVDKKFVAVLQGYITGSSKWSSLDVETNWQNPDFLAWGQEHPGVIPSPGRNIAKKQKSSGYKLPKALQSNLTGQRILTFRDLVLHFKSLFHIRRDNSLRKILTYVNKKLEDEYTHISFSADYFRDNIELLTDVDKLIQAYKIIIRICKKYHEDKRNHRMEIELSFYEKENGIYFCIHDLNSVYGKDLKAATERIGEEQQKLIEKQINGLCDLEIEADFDGGDYARIGIWNKNSAPLGEVPNVSCEKLGKVQGVKYILKFS